MGEVGLAKYRVDFQTQAIPEDCTKGQEVGLRCPNNNSEGRVMRSINGSYCYVCVLYMLGRFNKINAL